MKSILYPVTVFLFLFALVFGGFIFSKPIKRIITRPICPDCNVILVSLDTLGSNHLPCYGYERNTAPNLCKFAKENVYFTNSYSNASWTLPSHFSIFTSLYPKHHGMQTFTDVLSNKTKTITEVFKDNQYKTIYVGPTDDRTLPLDKGLGRGFDEIIKYNNPDSWQSGYQRFLGSVQKGQKTLMFLHTYAVHDPYLFEFGNARQSKRIFAKSTYADIPLSDIEISKFTPELRDFIVRKIGENEPSETLKVSDSKERKRLFNYLKEPRISLEMASEEFAKLPPSDRFSYEEEYYVELLSRDKNYVDYARDLYDEGIYLLDKKMTRLFDMLKDEKIKDNTVVIITSDHGEEFMEHGQLTHTADHLYNTTTSTALIFYIPGIKKKAITAPVQSIDIMPTILNIVGLKTPKGVDGINLNGLIKGSKDAETNQYVISEGPNDSISDGNWKLYVGYFQDGLNNKYELYDLKKDPGEKNDLALKNMKKVNQLLEALNGEIYKK